MIFEILKNYRRRQVLRYLDRNRGEATLDTLAGLIAAEENGIDAAEVTSSQRKRVYISLYQSHLPKMDDVGVIDYDRNRGRIELTDASEYLFPYLYLHSTEYSTQTDDSWRSIGWIHSKIRDALSNGIALGRRER